MLPASAALLASLALQAGVTRYTVSLNTQARYLTDLDSQLSTTALELLPYVGLAFEERTSTLGLAYLPRLVMVIDSPPPQLFHQAALNLALEPTPMLRFTGSASGCYGTNDFRVQYAVTCGAPTLVGAGPQPVPLASTVRYMSATGAVGFESRPSARIAVSGTLSYLTQGGADAPTRALLPLQRGPSFLVALGWTAGRGDVLSTSLSGSYYTFLKETLAPGTSEPSTNAWISQAVETWNHDLGRQSRLRLGLGLGLAGNATDSWRLVLRRTSPVGEIGIEQGFGQPPLQLNLGVRVAPFVDFTSSLAYDRTEAFAGLGWPLDLDWRVDAGLSASIAVDGIQRGQATGTGQFTVTWAWARWVRLYTGLSGLWQRAGLDFPAGTIRQLNVVVGVTVVQSGQF